MAQEKFLITGATGMSGTHVVEQLLEKGHSVRILAHQEDERSKRLQELGAEVAVGDLLELATVRPALQGISGAYFVYPVRPGLVEASVVFAQAAKEAGVKIIVNMSQNPARPDAKSKATLSHWLSEQVFAWSGVPAANLRAGFFTEWLLYARGSIAAGTMKMPWGSTVRHAPVATEDLARVTVGIFANPEVHGGKTYPLFGPVEYTYPEIAKIVGGVIGKDVGYEQVSVDDFAASIGMSSNSYFKQHCEQVKIDHENRVFEGTNDLIAEIGGRPSVTVEQFATTYRPAFV